MLEINLKKKRFAGLASIADRIFNTAIENNRKNVQQMTLESFDVGGNMQMIQL